MRRLVCEYYEGFNFGGFVRNFPDLRGKVTDLLIGDLFTDKVDVVWEPMESLYPDGKEAPKPWNSGTDPSVSAAKHHEMVFPDGHKP